MGKQRKEKKEIQRRKDVILDSRALRKKAEHQRKAQEEDVVGVKEVCPSIAQRPHENPEPKRAERRKAKRLKEAQDVETCCIITTVPSVLIDEAQKLDQAAGGCFLDEDAKCNKDIESEIVEPLDSPNAEIVETVEEVDSQPQVIFSNPSAITCIIKKKNTNLQNFKKIANFLSKRKYIRPQPVQPEDNFDVELEIIRISELLGKGENTTVTSTELQEFLKKETARITKKKNDFKNNFRKCYDDNYNTQKSLAKNQISSKVVENLVIPPGPKFGDRLEMEIPKKQGDKIMKNLHSQQRKLLDEIVDMQVKGNVCSDGYVRILSRLKTHQSVVQCSRQKVDEKSNPGKNVLKKQIDLLECAYSHLSTKGLDSFSKRASTSRKDWRKMIISYESKKENNEKTFQQLSETVREEQSKLNPLIEKLQIIANEQNKGYEKREKSIQDYEARVVKSSEYQKAHRQQNGLKREIFKANESVKKAKLDLQATLEKVQEAGTEPPNYDHLITEWHRIKDDIMKDMNQTKTLRKKTDSIQAEVQNKSSQVLQLQLRSDNLIRELNAILEDKAYFNQQFHIVEYQRKKLNFQYKRIQNAF